MKYIICIVCPKGCHLRVDDEKNYAVTGNGCQRGVEYGKKELTNPTRIVTSTVCIQGAEIPRIPVKTSLDIPKQLVMKAMELLDGIQVTAPIQSGDVILCNILNSGADFVATRSLENIIK